MTHTAGCRAGCDQNHDRKKAQYLIRRYGDDLSGALAHARSKGWPFRSKQQLMKAAKG